MKEQHETVAIIGLGYVGLPLALLADRKGYRVIGIDTDADKIEKISKRVSPYVDEHIEEHLPKTHMLATTDVSRVAESSIVIICVPTPVYENHMPNLEPVRSALMGVAPYINKGHLVVLESTVNPGVCDTVVIPTLESISGMQAGVDFHVSHCPERINPGDPQWNVENIPRVVGSHDEIGLDRTAAFYESILSAPVKRMGTLKEAEAVKIVENSFRDINIAFVNELAQSFSRLGIDVVNVINGAATKPFAFLAHYPGCGVGGHCIPVDPYYLIEYARENGFVHRFLALARHINNGMPQFAVDLVEEGLRECDKDLRGSKVAVLGLSYKADIDDCRESPSFHIIKHLTDRGAKISSFDPYVRERSTASSLEEAVEGSQAVVIATSHALFKTLDPKFFTTKGVLVVVDGRNCLNKDEFAQSGIIYKGIGRGSFASSQLYTKSTTSNKVQA